MPTPEPLSVRPEDLASHAGHVDAVAAAVELAKDAGQATKPGPEAYGKLCTMVPMLLNSLQGIVIDGIDAAGHSLRDTADRLRTTADAYQSTDQRNADALRSIGGPP
jgi:hypothetical protein